MPSTLLLFIFLIVVVVSLCSLPLVAGFVVPTRGVIAAAKPSRRGFQSASTVNQGHHDPRPAQYRVENSMPLVLLRMMTTSSSIDNSTELVFPFNMSETSTIESHQTEQTSNVLSSIKEKENDDSTKAMLKEIASLGVPALGGLLVDPLMSLVDTACVGQVCSLQLASLAPCTSICQFIFSACLFLSATTTNLVASPESTEEDRERVVSSACILALMLGSAVTAVLILFANPLLSLAGCHGATMQHYGRQYLCIRALGMPFVLHATVLQGASLGRQDAWTPLQIFATAGLLNLLGDAVLTLHCGWGVKGAAIATVASQAAAALYYTYRCTVLGRHRHDCAVDENSTSRGVRLQWRGMPSIKMMQTFAKVAATLFLRAIGSITAFSALTKTAASLGSATTLAAHQVTLTLWWLFSYLPEPMTVAAQSLVARDIQNRPRRVPKLVRLLFGMSFGMGCVAALLTGVSLTVPAISSLVVADPAVRSLLLRTAPFAMLAQLGCSAGCLADGVCVGSRHFGHVPFSTIGSTLLLAVVLRFASGYGLGVGGIWLCSNAFFYARFLGNALPNPVVRGLLLPPFRRRKTQEKNDPAPSCVAVSASM